MQTLEARQDNENDQILSSLNINDIHCFLCNHYFNDGEVSFNLFDKMFNKNGALAGTLAAILSTILNFKVEPNEHRNIHWDSVVCTNCNETLLEYKSVEEKYSALYKYIQGTYYKNYGNCPKIINLPNNELSKSSIEREPEITFEECAEDDANSIITITSEYSFQGCQEEGSELNSMKTDEFVSINSENQCSILYPLNTLEEDSKLLSLTTDDIIIYEDNDSTGLLELPKTSNSPIDGSVSFLKDDDFITTESGSLVENSVNILHDNIGDNVMDGIALETTLQSKEIHDKKLPKTIWFQKRCFDETTKKIIKSYVCKLCPQNEYGHCFKDQMELKLHFECVHHSVYYSCQLCKVGFEKVSDKLTHDERMHKSQMERGNQKTGRLKRETHELREENEGNLNTQLSNSNSKCNTNNTIDGIENANDKEEQKYSIDGDNHKKDLTNAEDALHKYIDDDDDHHDITSLLQFACNICQGTFDSPLLLRLHKRTHSDILDKPYECVICYKRYRLKTSLNDHLNSHTDAHPYQCPECLKDFATRYSLQTHLITHTERQRTFSCETCHKSFLSKQSLNQHRKTHEKLQKRFKCTICDKEFVTQNSLNVHNIMHTGHRPYVCGVCGKSFARRVEVEDHERIHTGERPFKCDLCPLAFAQRSNMNSHRKMTHYKEKRHKCEVCGRLFKRRRILHYHRLSAHSTERPHQCQICGSSFIYPEHYKKHMLIHSGHKPYSCEICGKSFSSRDNRNSHRYVHSKKKMYECMECGAGFMRKPQILRHMKQNDHISDTIIINQAKIEKQDGKISLELESSQATIEIESIKMELEESTESVVEGDQETSMAPVENKTDGTIESTAVTSSSLVTCVDSVPSGSMMASTVNTLGEPASLNIMVSSMVNTLPEMVDVEELARTSGELLINSATQVVDEDDLLAEVEQELAVDKYFQFSID